MDSPVAESAGAVLRSRSRNGRSKHHHHPNNTITILDRGDKPDATTTSPSNYRYASERAGVDEDQDHDSDLDYNHSNGAETESLALIANARSSSIRSPIFLNRQTETFVDVGGGRSVAEAELGLLSPDKGGPHTYNSYTDSDLELDADADSDQAGYGLGPYTNKGRTRNHKPVSQRERKRHRISRKCWQILFGVFLVLLVFAFAVRSSVRRYILRKTGFYGHEASESWYPSPLGGTAHLRADSYRRAQELVANMTLVQKVNITTGTGWQMGPCVGNTGPVPDFGFPSLCLQDGPLGIRFADNITAFPAGITTGATWNRDLMRQRGFALGQEARTKGINVMLGPAMGPLGMMPAGGRNWEGFGSDPVLQGVAAAETIRGIQRTGVMATAKHFLMNEQEHYRQPFEWGIPNALSSNVDDRVLHEVFVWPFAESVRADVASVMCAYQQVNNVHSCENSKLLNGILKDELGFQGFVQSDWLAQRSGVNSALAGLDMSMPGDGLHWADGESFWGGSLTRAVLNTSVPMERLNDMVTRIVAAWYHFRQDSWSKAPPEGDGGPNFSSWTNETIGRLHPGSDDDDATGVVNHFIDAQGKGSHAHGVVARQVAAEGTVLLKNVDGLLPLSRQGPGPDTTYRVGVFGEDAGPGDGPNACPDRSCNQGTLASGWGSGAVEFPYLVTPWEALQTAWTSPKVSVDGFLSNDVRVEDVRSQDLCIVFANADGGEGFAKSDGIAGDRNDLFLQKGGDQLVETVAKNCGKGQGKTIVVVHAVGPVVVERWIDLPGVHAFVFANLPGQESGNALVDVLFGDVDASGRLPFTIGKSLADYGAGAQVLYEANGPVPQVNFTDGLFVDYRYFDRHNITPRYEFGFGLSYTTFAVELVNMTELQRKSTYPSPRPPDQAAPPFYETDPSLSSPMDSLFPTFGFRKLHKYIYPYLSRADEAEPAPYPSYPDGYTDDEPHPTSHAGGGPGGNPSLYEEYLHLQIKVTNTGLQRTGKEVVQVYVSFPEDVTERHRIFSGSHEKIDFPVRVLRNFTKVEVEPGQARVVNLTLSRKDLSYWSVRKGNWIMPTTGRFKVWVGRSSRDLPVMVEW